MTADLWAALCNQAERRPDHPAFLKGDRETSFAQWRDRALDYAVWLRANTAPGERTLQWMDPSPEAAAALFGCWAAGRIPVLLDPRSKGAQLERAVAITQPAVAFTGDRATPLAKPGKLQSIPASEVTAQSHAGEPASPSPSDDASIVFTSGSTGGPKGVVQSHASLANGCRTVCEYLGLTPDDRIVCPIPWSFDYGFMQLQATAWTGACQVLPVGPTPADTCSAIETHRATVLPGVPSVFAYLLERISPFRQIDRSSIRLFTNTGGSIPSAVFSKLRELLDSADCVLNYGLTESYRTSTLAPEQVDDRPNSIGRAIPGVEVTIARDDGSQAQTGETGEIVHRGNFIFLRYWNDPEATSQVRRPDPWTTPGTQVPPALFTGDLGRFDADGYLYFEGRRDAMIKCMGVRVCPEEVEASLLASDLIEEAAVFGLPHELMGQQVCAAVVARPGVTDLQKALLRYARTAMSAHMIPRRTFVMTALPRTSSGKVDYPALLRETNEGL